jgi:hypothetical protein
MAKSRPRDERCAAARASAYDKREHNSTSYGLYGQLAEASLTLHYTIFVIRCQIVV